MPDTPVALALLEALGEPLLSCTLMLPHEPMPPATHFEIRDLLQSQLDLVIDGGYCGIGAHHGAGPHRRRAAIDPRWRRAAGQTGVGLNSNSNVIEPAR